MEVLKAKKKCEDNKDTEDIGMQTCDSHDSRVAKMNARTIIKMLPGAKDPIATSHGLIKKKDVNRDEDGEHNQIDMDGDEVGTVPAGGTAHGAKGNNEGKKDVNKSK